MNEDGVKEGRMAMAENNTSIQQEEELRSYILGVLPLSEEERRELPFLFLKQTNQIIDRLNRLANRIEGKF